MAYSATHDDHGDHKPGFFKRWFYSTNHKDIGTLYLIFAIFSGIYGGFLSVVMRMELQSPGLQYFSDPHVYNVFTTAHGLIMIFFMVMPALIGGFANWMVPIMIGAPDMAFPRMNNISLLAAVPASAAAGVAVCRAGGGLGQAGLDHLSAIVAKSVHPGPAMDLAIFALHLAGASSILGASTSSPRSSTCVRRA